MVGSSVGGSSSVVRLWAGRLFSVVCLFPRHRRVVFASFYPALRDFYLIFNVLGIDFFIFGGLFRSAVGGRFFLPLFYPAFLLLPPSAGIFLPFFYFFCLFFLNNFLHLLLFFHFLPLLLSAPLFSISIMYIFLLHIFIRLFLRVF